MAERPLYTLYKNLKAQNFDVPDDYDRFESALTRNGKDGADNRHAIYNNLKAQNFDVPDTYERFYSALFHPVSKDSSRANGGSVPMSAADKARFSAGASAISASAQQTINNTGRYNKLKQRKQRQQNDFGRVNIGTHKTPYGGDSNNIVKDDFAYNAETGKTGTYVTSDSEDANNIAEAQQKQAVLDEQQNAYQNAVDTGEIPSAFDVRDKNGNYDLQENIGKDGTYLTDEGAQNQLDKKLADAYARKEEIERLMAEDDQKNGNPLLSYSASLGGGNGRNAKDSDYRNKLATSLSLVKQQIGALEAVKQYPTSSWGADAWKALDNTAFTAKTWDFGLTDFATMGQMERIKTKMDNDIPLDASDKMLLKSKLGADAAAALEDEKMGNIYRWTKIAGQSLPFMADFFLTGGFGGITHAMERGALKFAAKRGMGKVSAAILKNTGIVAGDIIGSYAMAASEQALKTGADIMQRHMGTLYQDENGNYAFGTFDENGNLLHDGGESFGKALYKGLTSAMVENYTEKLFGHNYGIKKGAIAAMEKHGMDRTAEFFKNIGKKDWYRGSKKWMEKAGINGFGEEVMEEEIGIPLHALLDGDNKFSDLGDAKQQLDIIGGMAISVGSMYAMGAGIRPIKGVYNRAQYYRFKHKMNAADSDAQALLGDKWADLKDKIDNTTNEKMGGVLAGILRQRDSMSKEQINSAIQYAVDLMKMRGYNIAKTAEMEAKQTTGEQNTPEDDKQEQIDNAYSEGHDAEGEDTHEIQIDHADKQKTLAQLLGISDEQLSKMDDTELDALTGQSDALDNAIYDYQLSSARYQGVMDNAQDKVDLAAQQAARTTDLMTDTSRGTVRNATIQGINGANDYGVYIVNGNLATHDDGSINISGSDQMILYYDPTTGKVEHAAPARFASVGEEVPADDVKNKAVADAKEKAIREVAGIIDGKVNVGSQFTITDEQGNEHTYEVLADNGDGTAAITLDGNVEQNPYSFNDLQALKDAEDEKKMVAARQQRAELEAQREQQKAEQKKKEEENLEKKNQLVSNLVDNDGNVVVAAVEGNEDADSFIVGEYNNKKTGAKKYKIVTLNADGTVSKPRFVDSSKVSVISTVSAEEYKQALNDTESSLMEDNRGEENIQTEEETDTNSTTTSIDTKEPEPSAEPNDSKDKDTNNSSSDKENNEPLTLEDGTVVPMLEDGNPDFSKLTAQQTAELYDTQFGEDADGIVSGFVTDAKKALDKAQGTKIKGNTFAEQKAAKAVKDKAIADAQAAYDSAVAIRDAYQERITQRLLNESPEFRADYLQKAKNRYRRMVKKDMSYDERAKIWNETVGEALHQMYDNTSVNVFDTEPRTVEEYVSSNIGPYSLNYEGKENSKGVKQETGLSRKDFADSHVLAAEGKGETVDHVVHQLWDNRPSQLDNVSDQDIRNALISLITSKMNAYDMQHVIENNRIAEAEKEIQDEKDNAENQRKLDEQKAAENAQLSNESNDLSNQSNDLPNETNEEGENAAADSDEQLPSTETPSDATEEKPLGEQKSENDLPFSAKDNNEQETDEERKNNVERNKVDDINVVDNVIGKKTRKALERIAKMMGAKIQWQYSDKVGNGWYDNSTNTIYLTLDSSITEGVQFIFGHEMTHEIKTKNPAAYDELKKLVIDTYGDEAYQKAIDETEKKYSDAGFGGREKEYYAEEVVADAIGGMMRDLNYAHTLAMKMSHPLLAKIHEIVNRIRMAFYGTEYTDTAKQIMRSIEQAYVSTANGTFESSSNGERFSLKDEEKAKRIEKLRESKPVEITGNEYQGKYELNRESAQRYLLDNLRGDYTIKDTGETVSLAKKGAKKVTAHSMGNEAHLKSIAVIPQLIENSIFIEEQPAYKNDAKYDSYRYYVTFLKIGNEDYTARLTIGVKNGKSYYDHYLTKIEKGNLIDMINQSDSQEQGFIPTEGAPNTSDAFSGGKDTKLLEILQTNRQENDEKVKYSLRKKPEPEKKGIGYKVFVLKDGKLYPPMVANPNGVATPVGVWLDADAAPIAGESKTGRPQVKQGGKGTQGGSGKLAYRPGWHLGVIPYALQFNRKDAEGNKTLFPANFVFAEVEYAADKDYQEEARQEGINANGKYQHSLAGLKHLPTDGYYMYRTNPNPETDPWVITGAMKVNRILTRAEQADLVKKAGREPQQIQEGDIVTDDVVNRINQEIANAPKFSLKVYHGSGADFTEFDFDHMGEGAGSQAFGWGGYVTSSKKIGKSYATLMDDDPSRANYRIQQSNGIRFKKKYPTLESFLKNDEQIAKKDIFTEQEKIDYYNERIKLAEPYHNLYEVNIPDDNGKNYLDWDAPLSDELIDKVVNALPAIRAFDIENFKKDRSFEDLYRIISMRINEGENGEFNGDFYDDKAASQLLSSFGFTGIKYKAGRNFGGAEEGDTNYVIFKPEDMQIAEHTKFSLKHGIKLEMRHRVQNWLSSENLNWAEGKTREEIFNHFGNELKPIAIVPVGYMKYFDGVSSNAVFSGMGYFVDHAINHHPEEAADEYNKIQDVLDYPDDVKLDERNKKRPSLIFIKKYDKYNVEVVSADSSDSDKLVFHKSFYHKRNMPHKNMSSVAIEKPSMDEITIISPSNNEAASLDFSALDGSSAAKIGNSSEISKENGEKFSLKDEEYLKAVEDGDMEKAQKMVNEAAEAAGYSTDSSYQGTSAFNGSAPWGNGYFLTKEERKEAWDNGEFEGESTLGDYINDDVDGGNLEDLTNAASYRAADPMRKEAIDNVRNAIQKKSKMITMYRSVPSDVKEGSFRNGDWVTPSRAYAVDNAKLHGWGDNYNIIEQKVPVDDVWFDGNDIAEWGYGREEDYVNDTDFAYKNTKNNRKLLDAVTYDNNGNVIPLSQRFNVENPDVRFSLKDEKTMFGMHNISLDKLRKAIKQGGFAAPSMGVIDSKNGIYSDYGEITLIPKAEKLAKSKGKNAGTFTADGWTPTYPEVVLEATEEGKDRIIRDTVGDDTMDSAISSDLKRFWDNYLDGSGNKLAFAYQFLHETGKNPKVEKYAKEYPSSISKKVLAIKTKDGFKRYDDELSEDEIGSLIRLHNQWLNESGEGAPTEEDVKKFIGYFDKELDGLKDGSNFKNSILEDKMYWEKFGGDRHTALTWANKVVSSSKKQGKTDVGATNQKAMDKVRNNTKLNAEFDKWFDGKMKEYGVSEMLFAGRTPSGKNKYLPNTVDNAVKIMKKQNLAGGYSTFKPGIGAFIANYAPMANTLSAMKKAKDKLIPFGDERHKEMRNQIQNEYHDLAKALSINSNNAWDDSGEYRMQELAEVKPRDVKDYVERNWHKDVSNEWVEQYNSLVDTIKNDYPVYYFETKFMRPYGLDEFEKAIVPKDTPKDVVDALKKAGIDVHTYESKEDREKVTMDAINSSDDIKFSLKSMEDKPNGWKQANKKAIHIAEAIKRDPKFSLKKLDGTLIKAGTYFSGGGLVEEGLKGIIDPVVAVEYDEKISGVYRNNFGQHLVTADVRDVDPKELVKNIDGEVEYFHASPVCKNFSQAKANHEEVELDKETARSTADFINEVKPKVVTIENVKGYRDSEAMKTITDALDKNGYKWDADVYNAADYGGYTNRERLIVRAVREGELPEKPKKIARKKGWYEAVEDIMPTLTEKKNGVAPWMDVRLKADGIDWRNIDKPLYVMGSAYANGKVPHAFADELLPTLRTKSGDVIVMPNGKVYRANGRVLARVSGVSDDYKMPYSEALSHTIIGNGIPTQLTENVIAPLLTSRDPKFSIRTYHGTGANFDAFDSSHAFEGEGSETFGHGVYVTNSEVIGADYAKRAKERKLHTLNGLVVPDYALGKPNLKSVINMLGRRMSRGETFDDAKQSIVKMLEEASEDLNKEKKSSSAVNRDFDEEIKELREDIDFLNNVTEDELKPKKTANRYDVEIPDDNGQNYLVWDGNVKLPLQWWAELYDLLTDGFMDGGVHIVKDQIGRIIDMKLDSVDDEHQRLPTLKGEEVYHALEDFYNREDVGNGAVRASEALSKLGIVGMKYRAGMIHGGTKENDYNYVIYKDSDAKIVGNTKFSLRVDQYQHDLEQWKKDNNLPKDAQRPSIPVREPNESARDFMNRVREYRKQMALWKTAPQYEGHLLSDDTAQGQFNLELQKSSVIARIALQDSMLAIRKAQEAIMKEVGVDKLNMAEDAYTAENRSHGKGKNEFEEYNDEFLQPLRKAYNDLMKKLGKSYDNVKVYMIAKHGLERNAQMAFKMALENDYEKQEERINAYKAYKSDMDRLMNDGDFMGAKIDFTTWRQRDNAIRIKYAPSFLDYRYDKMGIAIDYSGLSALFDGSDFEEAAADLVKDVEDKHGHEAGVLWNTTNRATKKILRDGYKAGMMSKEVYEYVRDMYRNYIPLRGWSDTNADQVWNYVGGGKGAFNQTLKEAHGRGSLADDPIAYIENMAESGILLNNKNWVKQHLLLLAQNHPTSLLNVSKAWYVKTTDANGNEQWIPATPQITSGMTSKQVAAALDAFQQKMEQMEKKGDATQKREHLEISYPQTNGEEREHEVRVMKDGEEYVIYVNGDPQLAQAMNNTRAHRVREGLENSISQKAIAWLGRKMAAAYTSLSPLFIPSNFFRDTTMTLASTAIREDARYNYLLRKNMLTHWNMYGMVRSYQNGKLREKVRNGKASKTEEMFYDFMMNGGETGFVSSLDVEDLKRKFKNDLKDMNRMAINPKKVGHLIMDEIETLNRAIEDSNRFVVYMTSIQYGRSIDEAVNDAKDVTLNFNRKGTGEHGWQTIRNLYLFINPAVQSLQTLGALAKHHPFKFTAVTTAWLASGLLVPMINNALMSMFGGDDDKDKYWSFTKWDRRNNLIMWVGNGNFVKIPLAQEFRGFYGVGDMIASKLWGGEKAEESWEDYGMDMLGQVVDMMPLDPTGYDGNIAVSLMPNPIRPMFELAFNVDFTGKPLFKDSEYNKYDPNFTKAYAGTPDWLVRISRMVNSVGNDYPDFQQNAIDSFGNPKFNLNNPAVVDHVLSSYLGGAYTMGSQILGIATKALNDPGEVKTADIPLVSKFVGNPDDRPVTKKKGDEFWVTMERHDRAANTLSKLKKQAKVDGDYSTLEHFFETEQYKQYKLDDKEVKKYQEEKKKEKAEEMGDESYRPHKTTYNDIYKNHATAKDDFEDMKLSQLYSKVNAYNMAWKAMLDMVSSQADSYYNENATAIQAAEDAKEIISEMNELKKGFLSDNGKDAWNAEDMKRIRDLRKEVLPILEKANKVLVERHKKAKKKK